MKNEQQPQASQNSVSRRVFLSGVAGVGAMAALSACGGSTGASPAPGGAGTGGATATRSAAATGKAGSKGKQRLVYWTWESASGGDPRGQAQAQILDAFRAAHPSVELVEQVVPWAQLSSQLIQSVPTGHAPDVSQQVDANISTLVDAGALASLQPYVADWTSAQKDGFMYSWDDTVVNGEKYAFRQALRPSNYTYYRKDLLASAGLSVPKTGADFRSSVDKLSSGNVYGWIMAFSKSDNVSAVMQLLPPMLWGMNSDMIDPATSAPTFQQDAGVELFTWLQDLIYKQHAMPAAASTMDTSATDQQFLAGKAATYFANTAKYSGWKKTVTFPSDSLGYAPFPNWADDPTKPGPANLGGGWTLAVSKSANQDLAWEFLQFMQSPQAELIAARVGGDIPTNRQTLSDPWFSTPDAAYLKGALDWLQKGSHTATTLKIKNYAAFTNALGDAVQSIIATRSDVASSLAAAAKTYSKAL